MKQLTGTNVNFVEMLDKGLFREILPSTPQLGCDAGIWGYLRMEYIEIDKFTISLPIWYGFRK